MNPENLLDLVLQALFFLVFLTAVNLLLSKRLITGSTSFWAGWLLLLLGSQSFINNQLLSDFSVSDINIISTFHRGAFVGFLSAACISRFFIGRRSNSRLTSILVSSRYILGQIPKNSLKVIFVIGIALLIQRITIVGLNINYFTESREIYNEDKFNILGWLGTHLVMVVYTMILFQGIHDAYSKLNLLRVIEVILYCSPLFLANATRTFLLSPIIIYLAGFLLIRSISKFRLNVLGFREILQLLMVLMAAIFIFAVIGFVRGGYGDEFSLYYTVIGWPVSTAGALNSWLNEACNSVSTNGLLSFKWPVSFLERLNLADFTSEKRTMTSVLNAFLFANDSARVIPRSIIPDLIFDFGENNLFISTFTLMFFSEIIVINFMGKDLLSHAIATMFFIALFMTIQTSIFEPPFVISIFWAVFFFYRFGKRKKSEGVLKTVKSK